MNIDNKELAKIKSIEFSLINPNELLKYSVCHIDNTNLYAINYQLLRFVFKLNL
jgi:hypothetical protein